MRMYSGRPSSVRARRTAHTNEPSYTVMVVLCCCCCADVAVLVLLCWCCRALQTTVLREIARTLADDMGLNVVVVDKVRLL